MINIKCLFGMHNPIFKYELRHPSEYVYQCEICGKYQTINKYLNLSCWQKKEPTRIYNENKKEE